MGERQGGKWGEKESEKRGRERETEREEETERRNYLVRDEFNVIGINAGACKFVFMKFILLKYFFFSEI